MNNRFLWLAVIGAIVPYVFFLEHFAQAGPSPVGLFAAGFATPGASGFSADLVISSAVFWYYLFANGEGRRAWVLVAVNLLIGLSCALPLYLYLRDRNRAAGVPSPAERAVG